ncbi:MAG: response regulator [bacterium]
MNIVCIDDEINALDNLKYYLKDITEIRTQEFFSNPVDALLYIIDNKVDLVFCDIEMPTMTGLDLAKKIRQHKPNIDVVFLTGYDNHALESYKIGAIGYILKPYQKEDLVAIIQKVSKYKVHEPSIQSELFIRTFGHFDVFYKGEAISFSNAKVKELFALLIDKRGGTLTSEIILSYLWEEKEYNDITSSYVRRTVKQLKNMLNEYGIEDIFIDDRNSKRIDPKKVSCDFYHVLLGDNNYLDDYNGYYMAQYEWAEPTVSIIDNKYKTYKREQAKKTL